MNQGKARRARRRQMTLKVASRRRLAQIRRAHPELLYNLGAVNVLHFWEAAPYYFAKKTLGCRCSKKRSGQPKGGGWHKSFDGRPSWKARVRSRRLEQAVLSGRLDPEWVVGPRLFEGWVEPRPPRLRACALPSGR